MSGTTGAQRMTPSEALVETLAANGVTDVFGIVGSAYMDALDIFPAAGIRFIPVAHEQGAAHMADGYARASGRHGVCIAQNGPGITNFVTAIAAAYWAHSPVVFITPETGSMTMGLGGFQETEQLPIFSKITKFQGHVNNPKRMAEIAARCFDRAMLEMGPAQLNIPRDYFYGECRRSIAPPMRIGRGPGDAAALDEAAALLATAKFPVILAGGGVIMAEGTRRSRAARRTAARAGLQQLPAQRLVPGLAPALVRPARLPGLEGGDEADRAGRRRAGARHAPRAVRHAAAARHRLLAGQREDHPGRRRREDARPGQADLGRHQRRRAGRGRCADRAPAGTRRSRAREQGRALAAHRRREERLGEGTRRVDARARSVLARGREELEVHAPAPDAARAREGDAAARDGRRPTSATSARCRIPTCASSSRARCSRR